MFQCLSMTKQTSKLFQYIKFVVGSFLLLSWLIGHLARIAEQGVRIMSLNSLKMSVVLIRGQQSLIFLLIYVLCRVSPYVNINKWLNKEG